MKAYHLIVKLADHEWNNDVMAQAAREAFAAHPDLDPLVVEVWEHAGWYLTFTREGHIVETANDQSTGHLERLREIQELTKGAEWVYLPLINRNNLLEIPA